MSTALSPVHNQSEFRRQAEDVIYLLQDDDPDQIALLCRNNLAVFHWQSGREAEAVAALEELLADWQPVLGDDHHQIFRARNNLSAFLSETGQEAGTVIMSPQGAGGSMRPRRASAASSGTVIKSAEKKLGRNDPCHCGSGRKFKHCCGGSRRGA